VKNIKKIINYFILGLLICIFLTACGKPAADSKSVDYGQLKGDFSGITPEIAKAYLAVIDELSAHLGYSETEASEGECLHGGFVLDWDGDKKPELCLLLKTSPRDSGGWEGIPVYGWYPPTLYLYTYRNGQAVRVGECDLYFATAGREAAVAALVTENGMQYIQWEYYTFENAGYVNCYELNDGSIQKRELPTEVSDAAKGAETAQAFLDALGAGKAQLLLYNNSGEAKIEGQANARELRAALAAKAS
jgi:hypothetical protein